LYSLNQKLIMKRNRGTRRDGSNFSESDKRAVWNKGYLIPGKDPANFRKDICGAEISWNQHGNTTEGGMGWEIDHIKPVASDGRDELSNLQPLQWQNNRKKGDSWPARNFCVVTR
jgi:5-methylcytosine-specific restriction endonuclease McrA